MTHNNVVDDGNEDVVIIVTSTTAPVTVIIVIIILLLVRRYVRRRRTFRYQRAQARHRIQLQDVHHQLNPNVIEIFDHEATAREQQGEQQQQPGSADQQPGAAGQQPSEANQQPGIADQHPGASDQQPCAGNQQPGADDQQPGAGDQQPAGNLYENQPQAAASDWLAAAEEEDDDPEIQFRPYETVADVHMPPDASRPGTPVYENIELRDMTTHGSRHGSEDSHDTIPWEPDVSMATSETRLLPDSP